MIKILYYTTCLVVGAVELKILFLLSAQLSLRFPKGKQFVLSLTFRLPQHFSRSVHFDFPVSSSKLILAGGCFCFFVCFLKQLVQPGVTSSSPNPSSLTAFFLQHSQVNFLLQFVMNLEQTFFVGASCTLLWSCRGVCWPGGKLKQEILC